jgi:alpha-L-fucosidase
MGNGKMDTNDLTILHGIAAWWKTNGESIRGTSRTPLPVQAWGESTRKGNRLYLHVFDWPRDGKLVVAGLTGTVSRAYLLSSADAGSLPIQHLNALDFSLDVPRAAPDAVDSVVVLECAGEIAGDSKRLLLSTLSNNLRVFDGQLHGKTLHFGAGKTRDAFMTNWSKADDFISWTARLDERASFEVIAVYDAPRTSAGSTYTIKLGQTSLEGTVQSGEQIEAPLGQVRLEPGALDIEVTPHNIKGEELMRLRSVMLRPVGA